MEEHTTRHARAHEATERHWLCSGTMQWALPRWLFHTLATLSALLGRWAPARVRCEAWIRYRRSVGHESQSAEILTAFSDATIERLRQHPLRDRDQIRSGLRFWAHGLKTAFIWQEDHEPLCMQWLFLPEDHARVRQLPGWADLYPPLPPASGQAENIFTFPRGQRRHGGAATEFARAMFSQAERMGLSQLYTHIHQGNLGARRWAERTGWRPYGIIRRYHIDAPWLRNKHWCLHGVENVPKLGSPVSPRLDSAPLVADELDIERATIR
jgi:hypothetical protein